MATVTDSDEPREFLTREKMERCLVSWAILDLCVCLMRWRKEGQSGEELSATAKEFAEVININGDYIIQAMSSIKLSDDEVADFYKKRLKPYPRKETS